MKNLRKDLEKDGSSVRLLRAEKDALRQRILGADVQAEERRTLLEYILRSRNTRLATAILAVLVVVNIPFVYAAQNSAPGDLLHGLEIHILEPIERVIKISPETRIAYSIERMEERMEELGSIPDEELTPKDIAETNSGVQDQAQDFLDSLAGKKTKVGAVEQLILVSVLLNVHENELEDLRAESDEIEDMSDIISAKLSEEIEEYAEAQSPETLAQEIQDEIEEVDALIGGVSSSTEASEISNHLEEVGEQIRGGDLEAALGAAIDAKVQALSQSYDWEQEKEN